MSRAKKITNHRTLLQRKKEARKNSFRNFLADYLREHERIEREAKAIKQELDLISLCLWACPLGVWWFESTNKPFVELSASRKKARWNSFHCFEQRRGLAVAPKSISSVSSKMALWKLVQPIPQINRLWASGDKWIANLSQLEVNGCDDWWFISFCQATLNERYGAAEGYKARK